MKNKYYLCMKIYKFNENMKTVSFSDLKVWGVDKILKPKIKIGNKELDIKLGSKVLELFNNYGFNINIVDFEWMKKQKLLLPDEENLIEHRVEIGIKQSWKDFLYYKDYENYEKLSEEEKEKIDYEYDNLKFINNTEILSFSVFLPENLENLEYAALADASIYLKLLSDSGLKGVLHGHSNYNVISDETIGFKEFTILKKIKINNNNLEIIPTLNNRLYKDSKVFALFEEELGEHKFNNFFNEWLALIE